MLKKPKSLKIGDTIGIISPAGCIKDEAKLQKAISFLENHGFKTKIAKNALNQEVYLAGSDEQRKQDLESSFKDPEIKAILCSRGGYGCTRLLDKIDYNLISNNPKIFLGHSDITAFLNTFPIVTFHAPMAMGDFGSETVDEISWKNFLDILSNKKIPKTYRHMDGFFTINDGKAKGKLAGGNLCVLTSLLGTEFEPDFENKILLLEDLNEPLYKIDRMLNHLRLAKVFEKAAGVVIANFSGETISKEFLQDFIPKETPAIYGFDASHEQTKYTLPMGIEYSLNATNGELTITEEYLQ